VRQTGLPRTAKPTAQAALPSARQQRENPSAFTKGGLGLRSSPLRSSKLKAQTAAAKPLYGALYVCRHGPQNCSTYSKKAYLRLIFCFSDEKALER